MNKIDVDQIHGRFCPKCHSLNVVETAFVQCDISIRWIRIECNDCKNKWDETWTVSSVEGIDDKDETPFTPPPSWYKF